MKGNYYRSKKLTFLITIMNITYAAVELMGIYAIKRSWCVNSILQKLFNALRY